MPDSYVVLNGVCLEKVMGVLEKSLNFCLQMIGHPALTYLFLSECSLFGSFLISHFLLLSNQ